MLKNIPKHKPVSRKTKVSVKRRNKVNNKKKHAPVNHNQSRKINSLDDARKLWNNIKEQSKPPPQGTTTVESKEQSYKIKDDQKIVVLNEDNQKWKRDYRSTATKFAQGFGYEVLAPANYKPKLVSPNQLPQHPFEDLASKYRTVGNSDLVEIYAMDTRAFQKAKQDDWVPGGTIIASLGALSFENWDLGPMMLWAGAAVAGGWNLWARGAQVRRVFVEIGKRPDHTKYPNHPLLPKGWNKDHKSIQNVIIEYKNMPFSRPKIVNVPMVDYSVQDLAKADNNTLGLVRHQDRSFMDSILGKSNIEAAAEYPGRTAVAFTIGKHPMTLYLEHVRDLGYVNQLLARAVSYEDLKAAGKKM